MTDAQTHFVAFDGQQVAVQSGVPEVAAGLERHFRWLLQREPENPVAQLEAGYEDEKYFVRDAHFWVKSESLQDIMEYLTYEVVLRHVKTRPDLLWLHAGAVACGGRAVLIAGFSGRGKSTLAACLCARGWHFLSDDTIPLAPRSGMVFPFPQTPMFRQNQGAELPPERLRELKKTEWDLPPERVVRKALPVAALILPHYNPRQPAGLTPCSPAAAALELLQNCLNFTVHRETAFHQLCELVKPLPTFRLSFSRGDEAAQLFALAHANGFRGA